jgi:hypothetical protein
MLAAAVAAAASIQELVQRLLVQVDLVVVVLVEFLETVVHRVRLILAVAAVQQETLALATVAMVDRELSSFVTQTRFQI